MKDLVLADNVLKKNARLHAQLGGSPLIEGPIGLTPEERAQIHELVWGIAEGDHDEACTD